MNVLDRSNYFKGLLILAIKDNVIVEEEEKLLMSAGSKLGFEKMFCHNAIQQSLENEYLTQTPPVFSDKRIAEQFLEDGLKLAISDSVFDPYELQWLHSVADVNNVSKEWLSNKIEEFIDFKPEYNENDLLGNISLTQNINNLYESENNII